jgi:hypothetical protein
MQNKKEKGMNGLDSPKKKKRIEEEKFKRGNQEKKWNKYENEKGSDTVNNRR